MQEKEPSILASLGIDPTSLVPPPPEGVWDSAVQAAFDPSAVADPDTVPDMDDSVPSDDDDLDVLVVNDPGHDPGHDDSGAHTDVAHTPDGGGDPDFDDVPADSAFGDHGDSTDGVDLGDIHDHHGHDDHGDHDI
ncbi:hypothetical protein [Gordonia insulae]|uniref:Uncharacterized protein n=1 Tax=Gordonia insulae TaxID=2420509 RepID=A0A3G8JP46_9ACTN|nr:hypothetical protein [Gordonia insulae]AZG46867.1 hypothetical protein D7316_03472 [Gordonia insulae]